MYIQNSFVIIDIQNKHLWQIKFVKEMPVHLFSVTYNYW